MTGRIVAFGEPTAGDDGVGPAVLRHLATLKDAEDVELVHARDATRLVSLLDEPTPTVLVDAVREPPPGRVLEVAPVDVDASARRFASTHGFGVGHAIALSRALGLSLEALEIVGITIEGVHPGRRRLSPPVEAAVVEASRRALAILARAFAT